MGANIELADIGMQTLPDGTKIPLPPLVFGNLGDDPKKKTVLIYGHLDVQPALKGDGWNTEPFVLTEVDGKLYGRGATDDKVFIIDLNLLLELNFVILNKPGSSFSLD